MWLELQVLLPSLHIEENVSPSDRTGKEAWFWAIEEEMCLQPREAIMKEQMWVRFS